MKNKMNKKISRLVKKVSLVIAVTLIVAFLMMMVGNKIRANMIKENQESQAYQEWLDENCNCLNRERIMCPSGFELKNQSCVNEATKLYTNKLLACSEFNCSGEIKLWNNETGKWEN